MQKYQGKQCSHGQFLLIVLIFQDSVDSLDAAEDFDPVDINLADVSSEERDIKSERIREIKKEIDRHNKRYREEGRKKRKRERESQRKRFRMRN